MTKYEVAQRLRDARLAASAYLRAGIYKASPKSKKAPIRGHILLSKLSRCIPTPKGGGFTARSDNSVYLVCHRYKICLLKPLGGHGGSSYAHARGLHRAARFVRYAVFIERDGVFV